MLTFLFLVSLTATTVLLLAIAAEEVVRVTRALLGQSSSRFEIGDAAATAVAVQEPGVSPSHESAELRQFPQRARAQAHVAKPVDLERAPDRAA